MKILNILLCIFYLLFCCSSVAQCLCLSGTGSRMCIESLEEQDTIEKMEYIMGKYEEVNMKIIGTPIGIRGKRFTHGDYEEVHIVFQYIDHTINDIMQTCAFILKTRPGQCESIITICNSFLTPTPRPLLQREELTVCEDEDAAEEERATDQDEYTKSSSQSGEGGNVN